MNYAYVGSFTAPDRGGLGSGGISCFSRGKETAAGKEKSAEEWKESQVFQRLNPSFLCFDREKRHIYAAQGNGCMLAAFRVNAEDGSIVLVNEKHVGFWNSVSVTVDPSGKFLLAACLNNGSGGILSLRINEDGSLGEICDIEVPQGKHGPLDSQPATQPHQVAFDREGKYLAVCDKGLDVIHTYMLEPETGRLLPKAVSVFHESCCPRHVVFHPEKNVAYLLNEWMGGIYPCRYEDGRFTPLEWHRTAPVSYAGRRNIGAEIAVRPDGRFVYASNRGYMSIAVFEVQEDGRLRPVEWCTDHVAKPRFFTLSEDGKLLYCANEGTHDVSIYRIDGGTGRLTYLKSAMQASAPACILFR